MQDRHVVAVDWNRGTAIVGDSFPLDRSIYWTRTVWCLRHRMTTVWSVVDDLRRCWHVDHFCAWRNPVYSWITSPVSELMKRIAKTDVPLRWWWNVSVIADYKLWVCPHCTCTASLIRALVMKGAANTGIPLRLYLNSPRPSQQVTVCWYMHE